MAILGTSAVKGDTTVNGITVLPWRGKLVDFSKPTFPNQVWLVARADSLLKQIKPTGNLKQGIEEVKKMVPGHSPLGKSNTCVDPTPYYGLDKVGTTITLFEGGLLADTNAKTPNHMLTRWKKFVNRATDSLSSALPWAGRR